MENIHANGPNVFAHEQYVVNGAEPNTTYYVFTPANAAGLRGLLLGGIWQLVGGGTPVYATGCEALQLD